MVCAYTPLKHTVHITEDRFSSLYGSYEYFIATSDLLVLSTTSVFSQVSM